MAIKLLNKVAGRLTREGRIAIFFARKNRLVRRGFKLEVKLDLRSNINIEVQDTLDLRWDIA